MGRVLPNPESAREKVRSLMQQKENIETEISTHISTLKANGITSMSAPLIDGEGFPRADIDIYAVRGARVRIIELRNDLKAVMDEISKGLEDVYARPDSSAPSDASEPVSEESKPLKPFSKVNAVAPGSPAASAVC